MYIKLCTIWENKKYYIQISIYKNDFQVKVELVATDQTDVAWQISRGEVDITRRVLL